MRNNGLRRLITLSLTIVTKTLNKAVRTNLTAFLALKRRGAPRNIAGGRLPLAGPNVP